MSSSILFRSEHCVVAVAPIRPYEQLVAEAGEQALASLEGITSQKRRCERLAWRALLEELSLGAKIHYGDNGAPIISNSFYRYISVSHTDDCVAVMLAMVPCGVDVERLGRDFGRVAERIYSSNEIALREDKRDDALLWCAKEAAYKMLGREGVDFKSDIIVTGISQVAQPHRLREVQMQLKGYGVARMLAMELDSGHIVVFGPKESERKGEEE